MSKRVTVWINGKGLGVDMARGRKRREGVKRYDCGQIHHDDRGESAADAKATAMAARSKEVGPQHAGKYEAGFELGKAYLRGRISRRLLKAGEQWAMEVDRFHRMYGLPSPFPKAMDWLSARGVSHAPDPTPEQIHATANTHMRAITAISVHGRQAMVACRALCIEDVNPEFWPRHTWKALEAGLDGLASLYGIDEFFEEAA